MSAYINVEKRNEVFAELKGELYKKFRSDKTISVEWCLKTEQLLTFAISKARTEKDIEALRDIIMTEATVEQKQQIADELQRVDKKQALKQKIDKAIDFAKKPLCQQGGYGDVVLLGSVTLFTTVMGIITLLSEMIN